jgi:hypothetical protein
MMSVAVMCQLQLIFTTSAHAMIKPSPELPQPDLTIVSASYDEPKVKVRIKNAGNKGAPPSVLAVLLLKQIESGTNKPVAFQFKIPGLLPGETVDRTYDIGNDPFTGHGAIEVIVDYKNEIVESDERNNHKKVTLAPLPDLVIQSVEVGTDTATVSVFNKCNASSAASRLNVTIYKGADKKSGPVSLLGEDVPPLKGNTQAKIILHTLGLASTSSFKGRYMRLEVDPTNAIKEAVETNNWWETGAAPFPDPVNSCNPSK